MSPRLRIVLTTLAAIPLVLYAIGRIGQLLTWPQPGQSAADTELFIYFRTWDFHLALLSYIAAPALLVLLAMGWIERRRSHGKGPGRFAAYRINDASGLAPGRIDWTGVAEDYKGRIAGTACAYGAYALVNLLVRNTMELPKEIEPTGFAVVVIVSLFILFALTKCMFFLAAPILVALVARRVAARPARWLAVALVWAGTGLGAMVLVALNEDTIRRVANNNEYHRITPDDFREQICTPNTPECFPTLDILDNPHIFDAYGWERMILTEVLTLCLIAFAAALVLRLTAPASRHLAAAAVPMTIVAGLWLYCQFAAPWAFVIDWDTFVGDRILGTLSYEFALLIFVFDPFGAMTLGAYALSMYLMTRWWPAPTQPPS
jgi:hypothetical protein